MICLRTWLPSLIAFAAVAPSGAARAETAEDVSATLSQAFKKTPDPISDQDWSNIAGSKISESYEIQKGDTLWDISVTLFGNGFYWPKVWQLNGDIPNPHEISPGRSLTFTGGTAAEPPRLALNKTDGEDDPPEEPPAPVADGAGSVGATNPANPEDEEGPIIPPPQAARKEVLRMIPPSFKSMQSLRAQEKYDDNGFNLEKEAAKPPRPLAVATVLVSDEIPSPIAKIREFEAGAKYGTINQKVFLRSLDIQSGDKLSVYNIGDEIKAPKSSEYQGRALLTAGEISVIGRVGSAEDLFEGLITYATDLMSSESLVLKGGLPRFDYSFDGQSSQIDGKIVGGEGGQKNRVFGNQNIVFLNVGRGNGVKEGMIFDIFKGYRARGKPDLENFVHRIGTLKVIRLTQERSTAVILSTKEPVLAGDQLMKLRAAVVNDSAEDEEKSDENRTDGDSEEEFDDATSDEGNDEEN